MNMAVNINSGGGAHDPDSDQALPSDPARGTVSESESDLEEHDDAGEIPPRSGDAPPRPNKRSKRYTVNGEPNMTDEESLSLAHILEHAGAGAAIDVTDLANYYLEDTRSGRRFENLNDPVPIEDGGNFLAIHTGRTPVA